MGKRVAERETRRIILSPNVLCVEVRRTMEDEWEGRTERKGLPKDSGPFRRITGLGI